MQINFANMMAEDDLKLLSIGLLNEKVHSMNIRKKMDDSFY